MGIRVELRPPTAMKAGVALTWGDKTKLFSRRYEAALIMNRERNGQERRESQSQGLTRVRIVQHGVNLYAFLYISYTVIPLIALNIFKALSLLTKNIDNNRSNTFIF